jgi:hypothetical protein
MGRDLVFRIIIEQPPAGVDFALQKGSGSVYETVQKQRSQGTDLVFEFEPSVKEGVSDGMAALGGPFCTGSAAATICLHRYRHMRRSGRVVLEPEAEGPPRRDSSARDRGRRRA